MSATILTKYALLLHSHGCYLYNLSQVNASALFQIPPYNPISTASQITSPILLIPTEEDNLCLLQGAKDVVKSVQGDKGELVVAPGGESVSFSWWWRWDSLTVFFGKVISKFILEEHIISCPLTLSWLF